MNEREHSHRHELRRPHDPRPRSRRPFAILVVVLLVALGVAIATQVRTAGSDDALDSATPADLLVVLDGLNQREAALRQEITELETTLDELGDGETSAAALEQARDRLAQLSIQIGTAPASGPGLTATITDPARGVGSDVVLDVVQELRAAGAEAIQIAGADGRPVRIGVDSWVSGSAGALTLDGQAIAAPLTVTAIGDPPTLAAAMNIPGGVVDHVARVGGRMTLEQSDALTVGALRETKPRQYAQPR
ncbi:DUF881 domain-containing protein [Rhodococcus sp. HNM0569]|uniref:DUF881 domain-containing protein n=1 Tax=Rhodococcus sp. HNM0569 TaxID=2716340 RepID=UPI001469A953|nr:DUF881 domain-containing protein [Rhodococcus sp. HNM0569]